jgi:hypothetical protein
MKYQRPIAEAALRNDEAIQMLRVWLAGRNFIVP